MLKQQMMLTKKWLWFSGKIILMSECMFSHSHFFLANVIRPLFTLCSTFCLNCLGPRKENLKEHRVRFAKVKTLLLSFELANLVTKSARKKNVTELVESQQ